LFLELPGNNGLESAFFSIQIFPNFINQLFTLSYSEITSMSQHTIPIVDLSEFTSGKPEKKQNFVHELGRAFEDIGFVSVRNHGVPQDVIDAYYDAVKKFFCSAGRGKKEIRKSGARRSAGLYFIWQGNR
jgi:hypothetical protein